MLRHCSLQKEDSRAQVRIDCFLERICLYSWSEKRDPQLGERTSGAATEGKASERWTGETYERSQMEKAGVHWPRYLWNDLENLIPLEETDRENRRGLGEGRSHSGKGKTLYRVKEYPSQVIRPWSSWKALSLSAKPQGKIQTTQGHDRRAQKLSVLV